MEQDSTPQASDGTARNKVLYIIPPPPQAPENTIKDSESARQEILDLFWAMPRNIQEPLAAFVHANSFEPSENKGVVVAKTKQELMNAIEASGREGMSAFNSLAPKIWDYLIDNNHSMGELQLLATQMRKTALESHMTRMAPDTPGLKATMPSTLSPHPV